MDNSTKKMTRRERATLALLIVMYIFLMADSRLMSAIIPELSLEYGLSTKGLGVIGTAFVLCGAVVGIVVGVCADRFSRKKLLVGVVLVGEIPCLLTGFECCTSSLTAFVVLRMLTGIGLGGITPITYALVADLFSEDNRAKASAGITVAWAVGILMGPSLAGYLTEQFGWRIGFILAAVPNFPLALLFWIVAQEPQRGGKDALLQAASPTVTEHTRRIKRGDLRKIFRTRTNISMYLQGLFGTIPWGITGFWAIHYFEHTHSLSKAGATSVQNLVGLGAILGTITFGIIGDRLFRVRPKYVPLLCGAGTLGAVLPFLLLFNLDSSDIGWPAFLALAFGSGFIAASAGANVKAILMNVNPPENRGSVFGLLTITESVGPGFGPLLGSMFFYWWGMSEGMNFAILWWIPCGIALLIGSRLFETDRARLQKRYAKQAPMG